MITWKYIQEDIKRKQFKKDLIEGILFAISFIITLIALSAIAAMHY